MQEHLEFNPAYTLLTLAMDPNEQINAEPGAMVSMAGCEMQTKSGGGLLKGLKKAVGKTARAVSSGSDKLAKRMNEDYDKIAHLHESGLFSIEEIENVIEEGYKPID